jgi:hypothetical protein
MGDVVAIRGDTHEQLGRLALKALSDGRTGLALQHLAQAWLDASEDREDALPIAKQIIAAGADSSGNGAA